MAEHVSKVRAGLLSSRASFLDADVEDEALSSPFPLCKGSIRTTIFTAFHVLLSPGSGQAKLFLPWQLVRLVLILGGEQKVHQDFKSRAGEEAVSAVGWILSGKALPPKVPADLGLMGSALRESLNPAFSSPLRISRG